MQPEVSGESGLLVEIPEAEPVVGRHRSTCDVGVADGVPAHVTVLFPFAPASLVDDALLTRLGELFADQPAFDVRFDRTAWFDERVLFLAPVDPEPFIRLTAAAMEAFPEYPPYQGRHDGLTPHLTIGNGCPTEDLRAAERDVIERLPVDGRVGAVTLLARDDVTHPWRVAARFALAVTRSPVPASRP